MRSTCECVSPRSRSQGHSPGYHMRTALAAVFCLCLVVDAVAAQSTPDDVAAACTRAEAAGDWAGAARLMHPAALGRVREIAVAMASDGWTTADSSWQLGFKSRDEMTSAPDTLVYARVLARFLGASAELRAVIANVRYAPLGHVLGKADTAYAVARVSGTQNGFSRSQVVVHPVVRVGGEWRCLLRPPLSEMFPEPVPPPTG